MENIGSSSRRSRLRSETPAVLRALGRRVVARIELDAYGCQLPQEIVDIRPAIDAEVRVATPEDFATLADERTSLVRDLGWRFIGRVTQLLWRKPQVGLVGVVAAAVAPIDPLSTFMSAKRLWLDRTPLVLRRHDEMLATRRPRPVAGG